MLGLSKKERLIRKMPKDAVDEMKRIAEETNKASPAEDLIKLLNAVGDTAALQPFGILELEASDRKVAVELARHLANMDRAKMAAIMRGMDAGILLALCLMKLGRLPWYAKDLPEVLDGNS